MAEQTFSADVGTPPSRLVPEADQPTQPGDSPDDPPLTNEEE